jgi:hypothetical protein
MGMSFLILFPSFTHCFSVASLFHPCPVFPFSAVPHPRPHLAVHTNNPPHTVGQKTAESEHIEEMTTEITIEEIIIGETEDTGFMF